MKSAMVAVTFAYVIRWRSWASTMLSSRRRFAAAGPYFSRTAASTSKTSDHDADRSRCPGAERVAELSPDAGPEAEAHPAADRLEAVLERPATRLGARAWLGK